MLNFEYFLSCGIEGKVEQERYKKTPDPIKELMNPLPLFRTPPASRYSSDGTPLEMVDRTHVVIVFAQPDVPGGLFTQAGFDETDPNGFFATAAPAAPPLSSGLASRMIMNG